MYDNNFSKDAGDKEPSDNLEKKIITYVNTAQSVEVQCWKWPEEIPYAISTHFARHHEGCEKFVATKELIELSLPREERSQMNPVMMEMDANIQALIIFLKKELCTGADPNYQLNIGKQFGKLLREYDEKIIYWAMVPQCIDAVDVPEYQPCGLFEKFAEGLTKEELMDIKTRYDKV